MNEASVPELNTLVVISASCVIRSLGRLVVRCWVQGLIIQSILSPIRFKFVCPSAIYGSVGPTAVILIYGAIGAAPMDLSLCISTELIWVALPVGALVIAATNNVLSIIQPRLIDQS